MNNPASSSELKFALLQKIYQAPPTEIRDGTVFLPVIDQILKEGANSLRILEWTSTASTARLLESDRVRRLVSCFADAERHDETRCRFANEIERGRLELALWPVRTDDLISEESVNENYDPRHDYVLGPLRLYGENAFDVVLVHTSSYATDCVEVARLLTRDGGLILWTNVVSWNDGAEDDPSRRRSSDVASHFDERYYFDAHRALMLVNHKTAPPNLGLLGGKKSVLESIFQRLDEAGVDFVLLRNADTIPAACSIEADIDVLIPPGDFERARAVFAETGFTHKTDSLKGAQLYQAQPHQHFYLRSLDIHIDVVTGLYYTSLNGHDRVGVHPHLQAAVIGRRRHTDDLWRYTPSVNDSLLHLLCHCLYDKQACPPKYAAVIQDMFAAADHRTLRQELEGLFFRFAPRVEEIIRSGQTRDLHRHYLQFKDY